MCYFYHICTFVWFQVCKEKSNVSRIDLRYTALSGSPREPHRQRCFIKGCIRRAQALAARAVQSLIVLPLPTQVSCIRCLTVHHVSCLYDHCGTTNIQVCWGTVQQTLNVAHNWTWPYPLLIRSHWNLRQCQSGAFFMLDAHDKIPTTHKIATSPCSHAKPCSSFLKEIPR